MKHQYRRYTARTPTVETVWGIYIYIYIYVYKHTYVHMQANIHWPLLHRFISLTSVETYLTSIERYKSRKSTIKFSLYYTGVIIKLWNQSWSWVVSWPASVVVVNTWQSWVVQSWQSWVVSRGPALSWVVASFLQSWLYNIHISWLTFWPRFYNSRNDLRNRVEKKDIGL